MFKLTVSTNQEAFDAVARHLSTMPHRALRQGNCAYATPDGHRCAIGALIDAPDGELMGLSISATVVTLLMDGDLDRGDVDKYLLDELQGVHDLPWNWDEVGRCFVGWRDLRRIAQHYRLDTTVLAEFAEEVAS